MVRGARQVDLASHGRRTLPQRRMARTGHCSWSRPPARAGTRVAPTLLEAARRGDRAAPPFPGDPHQAQVPFVERAHGRHEPDFFLADNLAQALA